MAIWPQGQRPCAWAWSRLNTGPYLWPQRWCCNCGLQCYIKFLSLIIFSASVKRTNQVVLGKCVFAVRVTFDTAKASRVWTGQRWWKQSLMTPKVSLTMEAGRFSTQKVMSVLHSVVYTFYQLYGFCFSLKLNATRGCPVVCEFGHYTHRHVLETSY